VDQPEIFGRFVLLDVLDDAPDRPRSFRALDLERELQPLAVVRRSGPWRDAQPLGEEAAATWHREMDIGGVADFIDGGVRDGWLWSARAFVPGVPLATIIDDADVRGEPVPLGLALSVAYILAAVVEEASRTKGAPPRVRLQPRPRRVIVGGDGRVRIFGPAALQAHGHAEEDEARAARTDIVALAHSISALCRAGGGKVPAELVRRLGRAAAGVITAGDLAATLRPLMEAAGGGSYSAVGQAIRSRFSTHFTADEARTERELQLARRLRERRRRRPVSPTPATTSAATMRLRIRPASQEGPARLERVEPIPEGMAFVPGGRFLFSPGDEVGDYVDVRPFFVDVAPVSWSDWAAFCEETGRPPPPSWPAALRAMPTPSLVPPGLERTPVTDISLDDARTYARARGKRLLNEIEWELAARGFDGRVWPWGNDFDPALAGERWRTPASEPVTIVDADLAVTSPFGLTLLGHAWEWTSTTAAELADDAWVVRGGPWRHRREPPTLLNRSHEVQPAVDVTFRCARDLAADAVDQPAPELPVTADIADIADVADIAHAAAVVVAGDDLATDEGEPVMDDTDEQP
jgi:formylglycine-generating enzyme required for sulfatase activity